MVLKSIPALLASTFVAISILLALFSNHLPASEPELNPTTTFESSGSPSPFHVVVLVKTGATTAYTRLPYHVFDVGNSGVGFPGPPQHLARMRGVKLTRHFVSDHSMELGKIQVVDVLANLSEGYKRQTPYAKYPSLQYELGLWRLPQGGEDYHQMDRYKFVAMHQYAYEHDRTADFHLAMDDDTVMFYLSFVKWLLSSGYVGSEPHYIGSRKGEMADGGAGYLYSRAVLDSSFGSMPTPKAFSDSQNVVDATENIWCGDCSLSAVMANMMGDRLPPHRLTGGGWGFTYSYDQMVVSPENWYHPIFSVHHLNGAQTIALRQLETEIAESMPDWDDVRLCDVFFALMPSFFKEIFPTSVSSVRDHAKNFHSRSKRSQTNTQHIGQMLRVNEWVIDNPDGHANMTSCSGACLDKLPGKNDADKCSVLCENTEDCLSWTFHHQERICNLFTGAFLPGRQFDGNQAGYHVQRVQNTFETMPCRDINLRQSYRHRDMHVSTYFPEQRGSHSVHI